MSYYDNVKDNVKDKGEESGKPSFDTLKEEAEKTSVEEEEESTDDGTPIEVLEEGGLRKESNSGGKSSSNRSESRDPGASADKQRSQVQQSSVDSTDLSSVEEKLDKLIEQNQRIIEVLESFGN